MKRASVLCLGPVLGLLACARSPEPSFYTIAPLSGTPLRSEAWRIELRRPGLPGYLDRPQIVKRASAERLQLSAEDRWGAPMEEMVSVSLVENLARRLPAAYVFAESGSISLDPDVSVELQIQRFERSEDGSVKLHAQAAVHWMGNSKASRFERYRLSVTPEGRAASDTVSSMNVLLARLSAAIVGLIVGAPTKG